MPTLLEEPPLQGATPSARLRHTMAAVRLSFVWLGCRKTLSQEQKAQAADTFGAEGDYVSAAKKTAGYDASGFQSGQLAEESDRRLLEKHVAPLSGTRHPAHSPG